MTEAFLVVLNINIFLCHSEFLSDSLQQDADVFVFLRDCKRDAFNFFKSVQRVLYKIRQQLDATQILSLTVDILLACLP